MRKMLRFLGLTLAAVLLAGCAGPEQVSFLTEDGGVAADDSLLVNAGLAYGAGKFELRLDAFNLFDTDDNDITYFYSSRLPGEPAAGIEGVHFHPLEPRTIRASLAVRF